MTTDPFGSPLKQRSTPPPPPKNPPTFPILIIGKESILVMTPRRENSIRQKVNDRLNLIALFRATYHGQKNAVEVCRYMS